MCESNAYVLKNGSEELVMESVGALTLQDDSVVLKSIFGEEKILTARLLEINLTAHRIVLESV
jgi:predicted RNA-binding protein